MRLSDYFPGEDVLKDCTFSALGLSNSAGAEDMLSFLEDAHYAEELMGNPRICAVICTPEAVSALSEGIRGVVVSDRPRHAFFALHNHLAEEEGYALPVGPSVIPASCSIHPLAYIAPEGVELGEDVIVEEFVSIKGPCRIGAGSVLRAGAKIGGAGYEFKISEDTVLDVAHCGSVEIGENVILWENATVHRAVYPWDATIIETGCRIGANSHIDHGVKLGAYTKVGAGVVISGRTEVGRHAYVGPGSVVSNRISIGDRAHAVLGSVVTKNVPDGAKVSGNFAVDHSVNLARVKELLK